MQAAEALPPVIRLAADVVAGGDTKKLFDMMEKGLLDPMTLIPKITQKMREDSEGQMEMYWASLRYNQGMALRNQQEFTKKFLEAGGEKGLTRVFSTWAYIIEETMGSTKSLGNAFDEASKAFSILMLAPLEFSQWVEGKEKKGNFMTQFFGVSSESELLNSLKSLKTSIQEVFGPITFKISMDSTIKELEFLASIATAVINQIEGLVNLVGAAKEGGFEGFVRQLRKNDLQYRVAPGIVDEQIEKERQAAEAAGTEYSITPTERAARIAAIIADSEARNPVGVQSPSSFTQPIGNVLGAGAENYRNMYKIPEGSVPVPQNSPPSSSSSVVNGLTTSNATVDINLNIKSDGLTPEAEMGIVESFSSWWDEKVGPLIYKSPQTQQ